MNGKLSTAGILLAGGASRRMGTPKALLICPDGRPLAVRQLGAMIQGGCSTVRVVAGAWIHEIRLALPLFHTVENVLWNSGRATSLQAGVRAEPEADGWLFLPVDAAGVRADSIRAVLAAAEKTPQQPIRPFHRGRKGNLLWVPYALRDELLALPAETRIDQWVESKARSIPLEDPALVRNLNTPLDWTVYVATEEAVSKAEAAKSAATRAATIAATAAKNMARAAAAADKMMVEHNAANPKGNT